MSVKLTVVFYILICFEVGALLVVLPWSSYWSENFFLFFLSRRLHSDTFLQIVQSGYFRGAVSGLGLVNIGMGFLEIFNFRRTVETIIQQTTGRK